MLTTLPNLLTLSRIVAIPVVIATFYVAAPLGPWLGCVIFSLAAFTDWLDGQLARMWEQQSELGRFLDPVADKLLVTGALVLLCFPKFAPAGFAIPWAILLGIYIKEIRESAIGKSLSQQVGAQAMQSIAMLQAASMQSGSPQSRALMMKASKLPIAELLNDVRPASKCSSDFQSRGTTVARSTSARSTDSVGSSSHLDLWPR